MRKSTRGSMFFLLLALVATSLVSCNSSDNPSTTVQPGEVEGLLVQKVADIPAFAAALNRTLLHVMGMPQQGVNLMSTATGVTGTVGVDKDGDGFQEGTVAGTLTWKNPMQGIAGGATLEITDLTGNMVNMTADVAVTGPTALMFSNIVAVVPVEGARPEVTVTSGQIVLDVGVSPPSISGVVDFMVGDLAAVMTLTSDAMGPSAVVDGVGFSFTVP